MTNVVADAGFLVALYRRDDQYHGWAARVARDYPPPWVVCEAIWSEADHLLQPPGRAALRLALRRGALLLHSLTADTSFLLDLQEKYEDLPMSVADACIVRLSETLRNPLVLTTDAGFKIYRCNRRRAVPCVMP